MFQAGHHMPSLAVVPSTSPEPTLLEALYKADHRYQMLQRRKGALEQESLHTLVLLIGASNSSDTHRELGSPREVLSWHPGPTRRLWQAVEHGTWTLNAPQQDHLNLSGLGSPVDNNFITPRTPIHHPSAFLFQLQTTFITISPQYPGGISLVVTLSTAP